MAQASPSAEHVLPPIEQGVSIEDVRRYLGEELQLSTRQCVVVLAIDLFDMHKQGFLHGYVVGSLPIATKFRLYRPAHMLSLSLSLSLSLASFRV